MTGPNPETPRHSLALTDKDYISAIRLITRHYWSWQRITLTFTLLWLAFSLYIVTLNTLACGWIFYCAIWNVAEGAGYAAGIIAVHGVLTTALIPWRARKHLSDTRRLSSGYDVAIDASGFSHETVIGKTNLRWEQLERWHENAQLIILVIIGDEILVLPKSQLDPGVIADVRAYLIKAQVERGIT